MNAIVNGNALTERAKQRLRLVAGMLRAKGRAFDVPREQFYDRVQEVVRALPAERREKLRATVDWAEEYENAKVPTDAATGRKTTGKP